MRRAREDDSFTWEPFDHGRRRRMAALVAVGLCAGLVGLVAGRVSSGGSGEIARAPLPESAVTTKNGQTPVAAPASPPVVVANPATEQQTSHNSYKQIPSRTPEPMSLPIHPEGQTLPAPVSTVENDNDQALPPTSPPVVLLNPGSGGQNADVGERAVPEQARERQHSPALAPKSEKKNEQGVPPAQAAPRVVQGPVPSSVQEADRRPWPRQQNDARRSPSTDARRSSKSPVFRSERPANFADYGALRDYMMGR